MTIATELKTLLNNATSAADRVYPMTAPDGERRPHIIYQRISGVEEYGMSGSTGLINTRMQVLCFAETYVAADTLADEVRAVMKTWNRQNVPVQWQDVDAEAVGFYGVQLDFSIWHP